MSTMAAFSRQLPFGDGATRGAPIVCIRNLNYYFGEGEARNQVLVDNQLDVYAGEIIIMTGPSGSGKTTLLTLIGALRSVQEGSIQVLGRELSELTPSEQVEVRRDIGFIFQSHNLFDSLTAHQNVKMALELKRYSARERNQRATEILTELGLENRIYYKPPTLSGGQKQRVAIARALANRPRLILADEPTAALDEKSGRDVVTLLQRLAREDGCTSLMVTHDNRILDVADRIVSMVGGCIKSDVRVEESVTICEFLGKCPVFSKLTPEDLSHVAEKMERKVFRAGTVIFRQGEPGDKFYLVRKGSVDIVAQSNGSEKILATINEGDFFGETALLTGKPRNATVRTREDTETYSLDQEHFHAALESSLPFREQLLRVYFDRQ